MKTPLLLTLLLCSGSLLLAQAGTLSEEEITAEGHFLTAKQSALMGNTDEAIQQFEAIAKSAPDNAVVLFELGRLYFAKESYNSSIEKLEKAYELAGEDYYAYFLADVYETAGRNRDGAKLFGQLIRQRPDEVELYLRQADFYVRAQQIDDAIKVYDDLENRIGLNAMISRRKHTLYLQDNDQRKAERELVRLVDGFASNMEYRYLLAGYYQAQGQEGKAKSVYQDILRLAPNDVRAQLAIGTTSSNNNDDELMALISRSDVEIDLKIGRLLGLLQEVMESGDATKTQRITALAEELQRVHSDEAKAAAILGDTYYLAARYPDAAQAYQQALELEEGVYAVWEQYLSALYQDQQMAELRAAGQNAIDIFPNRPLLFIYQAFAEASRSNFGEASGLLQEAELMSGGQAELMSQVSNAKILIDALVGGPSTGRPPVLHNSEPMGAILAGRSAINNGNYQQAAEWLLAADHERLSNALLLEMLADVQAELGQNEAAKTNYERARAAGSKSPELAGKLRAVSGK